MIFLWARLSKSMKLPLRRHRSRVRFVRCIGALLCTASLLNKWYSTLLKAVVRMALSRDVLQLKVILVNCAKWFTVVMIILSTIICWWRQHQTIIKIKSVGQRKSTRHTSVVCCTCNYGSRRVRRKRCFIAAIKPATKKYFFNFTAEYVTIKVAHLS